MTQHNKRKRRRRPKSTAPQVPPRPPKPTATTERERPKAPWHPFPLVELCVFVGIICIGVGLFTRDESYGRTLLALGLALGSLGGLDTSVREHFGGYRSHTLVLALFPAVAIAVVLAVARIPLFIVPPLMLLIFGVAFVALRRVWEGTRDRAPV